MKCSYQIYESKICGQHTTITQRSYILDKSEKKTNLKKKNQPADTIIK